MRYCLYHLKRRCCRGRLSKLGKVYYFMDFAKMYIVGDFEIFSEDTNYNVSICESKDSELLAIPASIY